ncbi:unnamed protein product [Gemmata massiliana]|uniref:Uncharacterized protein n=1 Tax=Gemmata massiliana TaxID=1210884 RepID=A0A6P2DIY8_9BACT|nr:unnamed protein product [Gemmata massiliana]
MRASLKSVVRSSVVSFVSYSSNPFCAYYNPRTIRLLFATNWRVAGLRLFYLYPRSVGCPHGNSRVRTE